MAGRFEATAPRTLSSGNPPGSPARFWSGASAGPKATQPSRPPRSSHPPKPTAGAPRAGHRRSLAARQRPGPGRPALPPRAQHLDIPAHIPDEQAGSGTVGLRRPGHQALRLGQVSPRKDSPARARRPAQARAAPSPSRARPQPNGLSQPGHLPAPGAGVRAPAVWFSVEAEELGHLTFVQRTDCVRNR